MTYRASTIDMDDNTGNLYGIVAGSGGSSKFVLINRRTGTIAKELLDLGADFRLWLRVPMDIIDLKERVYYAQAYDASTSNTWIYAIHMDTLKFTKQQVNYVLLALTEAV
jgi:hypothetical protein